MEENSIEEDIEILEELRLRGYAMLLMKYEDRIKTNRKIDQAIEHILSDYKRVLKENEELLQEKINNQKMIALAQNDMLNYQAGFEDGKNGRTSAVQNIIENQQYYIFQKQVEKYEGHIEKLQKKNEELKKDYYNLINKIENKIDRFDYEFEKAKRQNDKDKSDYYWDLIRNFKKMLESEE